MATALRKTIALLCLALCAVAAVAQSEAAGDGQDALLTWDDFVQRMLEGDDDSQDLDAELVEQLEQLHASPLNLNTASVDELMRLPFIDAQKANDIVGFREKNGDFFSLGELMMIRSLSFYDREMLRLFVRVESVPRTDGRSPLERLARLRPLRQEAVWRSDIPFYTKAGFTHYPDSVLLRSPNKVYLGDRFHHSLRYNVSAGRHIAAGMQAEKDAGETGIDYFSAYVMVSDIGIVHRAIVGNYRVSFGRGLVVNNSARFGKMMMLSNICSIDAGISRHSSMVEDGYMSGAAATFRFGKVLATAFASHRRADATMRGDSLGIISLKTDGLHRTKLERSKDGNVAIDNIGGNVHWGDGTTALSATFVSTRLSVPLAPLHTTDGTLYRLFNAHGSGFQNASLAYQWRNAHIAFCGEAAFSNAQGFPNKATRQVEGAQNGFATLNSLQWRPNSDNTFMVVARWYGAKYVSINGKAFGENSSVQNEEGVLAGWTGRVGRSLKLTAYADAMYFPWLKYQVSASSRGFEGFTQAEYSPNRQLDLMLRYRVKSKQRDCDFLVAGQECTALRYRTAHTLKLQAAKAVSPSLTLRSSATGNLVSFAGETECGYAVSENLRWQDRGSKARLDVGLTYFNADSYDSRISVYEPSLLYTYGFMSCFYEGIRSMLLASVPLFGRKITLTAKFAYTLYIYRDQIGSGLDLIDASHREDLQLQVRWRI